MSDVIYKKYRNLQKYNEFLIMLFSVAGDHIFLPNTVQTMLFVC